MQKEENGHCTKMWSSPLDLLKINEREKETKETNETNEILQI